MTRLGRGAFAALALVLGLMASVASAQDDDGERGTIVLQVDGKEVQIDTNLCYLLNTDSGYADGFEFGGDGVFLAGEFDLNGDGKHNDDDKVEYDEDEELVIAKSLIKKGGALTPTSENADVTLTIPGLGECEVVSGKLTVASYKVSKDDTEDHWAGDIELVVKTEGGEEKTLAGTFDSGITGVW